MATARIPIWIDPESIIKKYLCVMLFYGWEKGQVDLE